MARETAANKKKRLAVEAEAATAVAETKTPDELTEDALADVADPEEPETEEEPEAEEVTPALKDTSMVTISSGKGGRRRMRMCDYQAEQAAEAAAAEEDEEEDDD
jgi:hypothetical protein